MANTNKISLSEEDFLTLVSGGVAETSGPSGKVDIILQDIGWDRMIQCIEEARKNRV